MTEGKPYRVEVKDLISRWGHLETERASWRYHWQELAEFLLPRSGRFYEQDRNRGERKHNNIYDSTGTRALRVLGAGLMAGATSPARRWFKLRTPDRELNEFHAVKVWLEDVTRIMETVFQKSNTYRALHTMYEELACFGTAASIVLPDFDNVIHHHVLTSGQYCLSSNYKGEIDTLYRKFEMTVGQMVAEFGRDKCSFSVQQMYDRGELDTWTPVLHAIEPRSARDANNPSAKHMPWGSYYFEYGQQEESRSLLRESGFEYFPVLAPRWSVTGGDIYGNGPGMEALGDIKQLQHQQLRKAQVIDYKTKPPLQVPSHMKNREIDTLPGGISFYDVTQAQAGIKTLFEVNLDMNALLADIQDVRSRIHRAFYADLFLMLASGMANSRMTATEVAERHEEKLLMLGPVLERMHTELLSPLIESTFARMMKAQLIPPPPEELGGVELDVEFVSTLAQAQRAVGATAVDRWLGNLGAVAQFRPDVVDKVDTDYWAENMADMLGVDPKLVVPQDEVDAIRQQRAEQQQAQEQVAMAEQQSKTIGNLAKADGPDNKLTNVMDQLTGYNTPGVLPS